MLKRFTRYVTQSVAGMIGISVYVLADTFFISVYSGADGLAVLNLILPVYGLIYAIGATCFGDELNRATPRTQAGLLECMEERQVTIEGVSYTPGEPFFVIATENPIESAGVFPLPEAQLDRFLIKLSMNLPTKEEELRILELYMEEDPLKSLTAVVSLEELLAARAEAAKIFVHPCIREYMVQIAEATRRADGILAGVSPRGTLGLLRCVKAYAYLQGRSYVIPDDVRTLAVPVLAHRLVCSFGSDTGSAAGRMENILSTVPVPTERFEP